MVLSGNTHQHEMGTAFDPEVVTKFHGESREGPSVSLREPLKPSIPTSERTIELAKWYYIRHRQPGLSCEGAQGER